MAKKKRDRQPSGKFVGKRKISELILEFAGDFIRMAETPGEKQNRLNAACSAWNIACHPSDKRQAMVAAYVAGYRRYNPREDEQQIEAIRKDLEALVQRKLQMFRNDSRLVVNARFVPSGDNDRLEVVSARGQ